MIAAPSLRLACLVVSAIATPLCVRADRYGFSEKFEQSNAFKPEGEITLANTNGSVTFRTWDRAEIRIEGEKRAKTEEELRLISVNVDLTDTRLVLKTDFPKRSGGWFSGNHVRGEVKLTVTVPATARLRDVGTTNGSVVIAGVRGPVRVHTVNGRLTATGLGADTSLETVNGAIEAEFGPIARDQKIALRTVNGSATVAFLPEASVTFRARSVNGSIRCDFPLQPDGKTSRNRLTGTIGGGATLLETETVNGSIHVKRL